MSGSDRAGHWPGHKGVKAVMAGSQCLLLNDNSSNTEKPLSEAYTRAQASSLSGDAGVRVSWPSQHCTQAGGNLAALLTPAAALETGDWRDMMRRWEQWDIITRAVTRLCLPP